MHPHPITAILIVDISPPARLLRAASFLVIIAIRFFICNRNSEIFSIFLNGLLNFHFGIKIILCGIEF